MTFDTQGQVLTLNLFPMQAGSSIPTPKGGVVPGTVFSTLALKVDIIKTTCTPNTSVMLIGSIAANSSLYPFGNVAGVPAVVFTGLTNDNPPSIKNVVELQGGVAVLYSPTGAGTIAFTTTPVTSPATDNGPTIAINAPALTTLPSVDLDASASTSNNLPLKFQWSVVAGAADIANPTAAKATGYLLGSIGTYTFRVTVADSKGNISTKT